MSKDFITQVAASVVAAVLVSWLMNRGMQQNNERVAFWR